LIFIDFCTHCASSTFFLHISLIMDDLRNINKLAISLSRSD